MDYRDKVVIITGGASGLGLRLGQAMAAEGAKVVLSDINEERLKEAQAGLKKDGWAASYVVTDVTSHQEVKDLVHGVFEREGRIDVMINNAGIGMLGSVCDLPLENWQRIVDVNINSVIYGVHEVYPLMIKQGFGQIVNMASLGGLIPLPGSVPYGMSKHAVIGLSLGLRAEAAAYGIKVNALCPSFVKTNILKDSETYNVGENAMSQLVSNIGGAISLEEFIPEAMNGIKANKAMIVLPKKARLMHTLFRALPNKTLKRTETLGKHIKKMRLSSS